MALIFKPFELAAFPLGEIRNSGFKILDFPNSDQTPSIRMSALNSKQPAISLTFGVKRLGAQLALSGVRLER